MEQYHPLVGSSTPQGLAPLSRTGVLIFLGVLTGLPLLWAIFNLFQLITRPLPNSQVQGQAQNQQKEEDNEFILLNNNVFYATLDFLKYNFSVCLVAGVVFFLIILGAIQNFEEATISLTYAYGLAEGIIVGIIVAVVAMIGLPRAAFAAADSLFAAHVTSRNVSNFTAYFVTSLTTLMFGLILLFSQKQGTVVDKDALQLLGRKLLAFAFGISTVAIGTKLLSVIYGKASEGAMSLISQHQPRLPRNHTNPVIVCKTAGQTLRKIVSNALDYNMYLVIGLACATGATGTNVIGADQNGEIIFDLSSNNLYLPLMAVLFLLCFSFLANVALSLLASPSSGDQATMVFRREVYVIIFFLIGFLALAAYLCLPVEFFLDEMLDELKSPYQAYLLLLIALIVMFALMISAEMQVNHPRFIQGLINASHGGIARNIVKGLSIGYLGNIFPMIAWSGILFLGHFWLGSMGVSLVAVGTTLLIPNYLNINTYFSIVETGSFVSFVGQLGEDSLNNLMSIVQNRKIYEVQIHSHFTSLALTANYAIVLNYVAQYSLSRIPLTSVSVLSGLFIGAMIIYAFGSIVLFAIQNIAPVLWLDLRAQGQQNAGVLDGTAQPDMARSNFIFNLNATLQLKYFLPFLYAPFLLLGLIFGQKMTLGMVIGMSIAGLQLSFSSGLSGTAWNSTRSEIFLGRGKTEQGEVIKAESICGVSADVGNQVGTRLKDAIGSSIHGYIIFTSLTNAVMAGLYVQLH